MYIISFKATFYIETKYKEHYLNKLFTYRLRRNQLASTELNTIGMY